MPRPVTLFTGQWADLPLATLAEKVAGWGFDGLELACWGDHFDVEQALSSDGYVRRQRELLEQHGLQCHAISTHLVRSAVPSSSTTVRTPFSRRSLRTCDGTLTAPPNFCVCRSAFAVSSAPVMPAGKPR